DRVQEEGKVEQLVDGASGPVDGDADGDQHDPEGVQAELERGQPGHGARACAEYRADPTRLKGEERVPPLPAHRLLRAAGRPSLGGPAGKARVDRLDVPASVRQPLRLRAAARLGE